MRTSIVVPVYDGAPLTRDCLDLVVDAELAAQIIVVDDASTDETEALLSSYGDKITVLRNASNLGFAGSCNRGAQAATGEFVVLLNNDTLPQPGWLDALVAHADRYPEAGIVGAKLLFADGRVQHAGVAFGPNAMPYHLYYGLPGEHPAVNHWRRMNAVTAACMLVRRDLFDELDGFDEGFVNCAEDVDLCLRAVALGHEVHYCPDATLYHLESATRGRGEYIRQSEQLYVQRWGSTRSDELDYLREDGLLTVRHTHANRLVLGIDPLLGSVAEPDALEAERAIDDMTRRWMEAVLDRDEALTRLRKKSALALVVESSGNVTIRNDQPEWRTAPAEHGLAGAEFLDRKCAPLKLRVSPRAPRRINVIFEGLQESILFGGHAAVLQLASALVEAGERVRVIGVDIASTPPEAVLAAARDIAGAGGLADLEYVNAFDRDQAVVVSPDDRFVAASWWTMRIAHAAACQLSTPPPLWLVQEYEPLLYPSGSFGAVARTSYDLPHSALISSNSLRDYLQRHQIGCFGQGSRWVAFENPLTTVAAPRSADLVRPGPRRLLAYLRPASPRNLTEVVLLGLDVADRRGDLPGDWHITGVGTATGRAAHLELPSGRRIDMFERLSTNRYTALLRSHDVGIALQDSPHPGLVALDMAAAGMLAITSTFSQSKTAEYLRSLSTNILPVDPDPEAVADAVGAAVAQAGDIARRLAGASVSWARSPEAAYPAELVDEVLSMISEG